MSAASNATPKTLCPLVALAIAYLRAAVPHLIRGHTPGLHPATEAEAEAEMEAYRSAKNQICAASQMAACGADPVLAALVARSADDVRCCYGDEDDDDPTLPRLRELAAALGPAEDRNGQMDRMAVMRGINDRIIAAQVPDDITQMDAAVEWYTANMWASCRADLLALCRPAVRAELTRVMDYHEAPPAPPNAA